MFAKFVTILSVASLLTMVNQRLYNSKEIKYCIYGLMLWYVFWIFRYTYRVSPNFYKNKSIVVFYLLLIVNILLSPYDPLYSRIIKSIGYLASFIFGYLVFDRGIKMKCSKIILFSLIIVPVILVGLFDHTPHKTMFFLLSNNYSFLGLCCALFLYTIYNDREESFKWAIMLLLSYIITASTLGVVVAAALSILLIHIRSIRLVLSFLFIFGIAIICVVNIDIPIFLRIRDVFNITTSLTWDEWANLKDMNLYDVSQGTEMQSDRNDNTSAIWRIAHWQRIIDGYIKNWWYAIPIGLGDDYSLKVCGYHCHNEFLKFFSENGIIVFGILISWIKKANRRLHDYKAYYFILAIICYHFTENLIDSFVPCVMFYFSLGYWYKKADDVSS